jgi:hypothetical protein
VDTSAKEQKRIIKARRKRSISSASTTASASAPASKKAKFDVENDKSEPLHKSRECKRRIKSHPND